MESSNNSKTFILIALGIIQELLKEPMMQQSGTQDPF